MTLYQLKCMVDQLVSEGHGGEELRDDDDPDVRYALRFVLRHDEDDDTPYVGVRQA